MEILLTLGAVAVLVFGAVVFFGAPYLPSMRRQVEAAIDLLDLKEGQTLLELGCGDGRVMRAAAERGWHVVGYELNPVLVIAAKVHTWRYRSSVRVIWGNYWQATWPPADGVFVFLLDKYMEKLDKIIVQKSKDRKIKLVSFAFQVPGKEPTKTKDGVYLYTYGR